MKKIKRTIASFLAMLLMVGSNNLAPIIAEDEVPVDQVTESEPIENGSAPIAEVTPTPTSTSEPNTTLQPEVTETPVVTEEPVTTVEPTIEPVETVEPTVEPTEVAPTTEPTVEPTTAPTTEPIVQPTEVPTVEPTVVPTPLPTVEPEILEYKTETDHYSITAIVETGSFDEKVQLQAEEIANDSEEYANAVESVAKEKETNKEEFENQYQLAALDIHFMSESGIEVEPNENKKVSVSIDFKDVKEVLGEDTDTESIEIHHIDNQENAEVVADKEKIELDTTTNTATTTFEVTQFSIFTVTWRTYFSETSITVKYVDENLDEIDTSAAQSATLNSGVTYTFPTDVAITGYTYKGTYVESYSESNKVNTVTASRVNDGYFNYKWTFTTDTSVSVNEGSIFYMVYQNDDTETPVTPTPGGTITDVDSLTKHKTVEPLGNDQYTLSLDVMGSQGTEENPALIDILFIIDTSGSMGYGMGSEENPGSSNRRIDKVANAISTLVNTVEANNKIDAHYAAVRFAGDYRGRDFPFDDSSTISNFTSSSSDFLSKIVDPKDSNVSVITPVGGTNYQAGIMEAKALLSSNAVRNNARKIVVFLSDGEPTFRYDKDGYTIGKGDHDIGGYNLSNAQDEIKNLAAHAFYTIGVANGYDGYKAKLESLCTNAELVETKESYSGKDLTALKQAFAQITSSIVNYAVSNVTVTDTLSSNAEFARLVDGQPEFTITVTDSAGNTIVTGKNSVKVEGEDITAGYDGTKFWMDFEDDYVLNPDYKYTISTTIQPTDIAYEHYRIYGTYPHVGNLGTGSNSSGKGGFYSNTSANVTYTYRDNKKSESYPEPVIQLTTIDIEGTKTWNDKNNHEGLRPESITVRLFSGEADTGLSTTATNTNWTYKFERIRKYRDGAEISYNVREDEVANYKTSINGYNITNTRTVEKITVSGTKTWDDNNNQDGKRPSSITVHLLANGSDTGKTATASVETYWKYSFSNIDKYANGKEIEYTVSEDAVEGYTPTYSGMDIENTHTPSKINISGRKTWNDADNQDGKRPTSITVHLQADGKVKETKTVTANDNWAYSFTDLDEYKDGQKITYTISEDTVAEYTTVVNGYDITNTHTPETTTITGFKTWDDNNNQDGKRPNQIQVKLLADGTVIGTKAVTENDNWSYTFTNLPVYKAGEVGKRVTYTIQENTVEGYTTVVNGYNIKNSYTPEKVQVSGTKTWIDADNQDGKRPQNITVNLLANGVEVSEKVVTARENWSYTFTDLDKYANGKEIVYTVTEDAVPKYTTTVDGYNITNKHDIEKVEVNGTKTWDDADNQDGKRPESITVKLLANGIVKETKTVTANDSWAYSFTNLDKYANGAEIFYTVTEEPVNGYTATVDGYNIKNSYTPKVKDITGFKTWDDNNNQDGIRPDSITVNLLADGKEVADMVVKADDNWSYTFTNLPVYKDGKVIEYTISEDEVTGYTPTVNGYNITNTHTPETISFGGIKVWDDNNDQDGLRPDNITVKLFADGKDTGKVAVANAANQWTYAFENVAKYSNGKVIRYTVKEDAVRDYTTSIEGNKITNKHTPEKTKVSVSKTWDDANDQDGIRPESITVKLFADNVETEKTVTLSERNQWQATFTDLNKYKAGKEINYSIFEVQVDKYSTEISSTVKNAFVITNKHTPSTISIEGSKTWDDDSNRDGLRPESITVKLLADEVETDQSLEVSEKTKWTYKFENLPEFKEGKKITYTVSEEDVPKGYESFIAGNNITNTHKIETVDVSGTKTWDDNNNQDGIRPDSIQVQLYADNQALEGKVLTVTSDTNWTYEFKTLPKNSSNGKEIDYAVREVSVPKGYESSVDGYDITNSHKTYTIDIAGSKTWNDADNQDGKRPDSITVRLLANGAEVDSQEVTAENNWTYKFEKVAQYANGKKIEYTVNEDIVEGYTTSIEGFKITNSYTPEVISISGTKTWDDADNQDGIRPESITVRLLANGQEVATQQVTPNENDVWAFEFVDLPKYEAGKVIEYKVEEAAVTGYEASYISTDKGIVITNTHTPATIKVSGTKTWNDADNQDGIRPETITIRLLANGQEVAQQEVSAETDWTYTFEDVDQFENGEEIEYTVMEDEVDGYDTVIDGYNITNTHKSNQITISGTKTWIDSDNQLGKRPETITVNLYADGEFVTSKEVSAETNWTYEFNELDEFKSGKKIEYSITEDAVEGYDTTIDGYNITNTIRPNTPITPEYASISINKVDQNSKQVIGAKLEIKDTEGNVLDTWTTDGTTHVFDKVEVDKEYVLHEASAPNGYKLAEDMKFKVAMGENDKVMTMVDQKEGRPTTPTTPSRPKTPTTGDHNNILFYGSMFLTSLLAALIALLRKRETE